MICNGAEKIGLNSREILNWRLVIFRYTRNLEGYTEIS